jgi:hypothetical protein
LGRESVGFGDLCLTGGAASQGPAFGEKLGTSGAMNGAIHAAASEQRRIRGVHDGIHILFRDVPFND